MGQSWGVDVGKQAVSYNGLSVLPYNGGTYTQAPFEDITKAKFDEMVKSLNNVDLSNIVETDDEHRSIW